MRTVHFQQTRTTWNYEKGDRARVLCEDMIGWHPRSTISTAVNRVNCSACMEKLVRKKIKELNHALERCGLRGEIEWKKEQSDGK